MSDVVEVGVQGGVATGSQADPQNVDPFAPPVEPAVSSPQPTVPNTLGVPVEVVEEQRKVEAQKPKENKNDQTRYEYWQRQAALREQAIQEKDQQLQLAMQQQQQMMLMMQQQQMAGTQQATEEEAAPQPPTPPEKPERPAGYNKEDALTDPESRSAQYLAEMDKWREGMDKYNQELIGFEREQLQRDRAAIQDQLQQFQQTQALQDQYTQAKQFVQAQYGLNAEQADEFVKTYSDPQSVSMDTLVTMYKLQHGLPVQPAQQAQVAQPTPLMTPSPSFQQVQRSQQVAPPMGVMPAVPPTNPANIGAAFMDSIAGKEISPDIWGT